MKRSANISSGPPFSREEGHPGHTANGWNQRFRQRWGNRVVWRNRRAGDGSAGVLQADPIEVRRYYANFSYQAQSWKTPRRVIAKVEWRVGSNAGSARRKHPGSRPSASWYPSKMVAFTPILGHLGNDRLNYAEWPVPTTHSTPSATSGRRLKAGADRYCSLMGQWAAARF